jgi:hypothetical protein
MKTQEILTAMAALALVAGCSGGKQAAKATPTPSVDNHRMMLEIAQCARAHGAPNFPDPIVNPKGDWDFPDTVQRQPKVPACDSLVIRWKRANPQKARPTVSPQDLVKLRDYAACMRQQGVSDWPDPGPDGVFKLPSRLRDPQRSQKQARACFSKAPKGGIQVDGGPAKGR